MLLAQGIAGDLVLLDIKGCKGTKMNKYSTKKRGGKGPLGCFLVRSPNPLCDNECLDTELNSPAGDVRY